MRYKISALCERGYELKLVLQNLCAPACKASLLAGRSATLRDKKRLYASARLFTFLCCVLCTTQLSAQFSTIQLNQAERAWYENDLLRSEHNIHTAVLPWRTADVTAYSRKGELLPDSITQAKGLKNWVYRKAYQEHLFDFRGDGYRVTIDPAVYFGYGQESESPDYTTTYRNSRGVRLEGAIGETFTFYTSLVETQARFAAHVNRQTRTSRVAPGYWLRKSFRDSAYDFAYAAGEIAYTPSRFFHFRLGRGKQFLGEGYRSMLISDNSVNYPFFRIETTFGKVKYVNLWSVMNDIRPEVEIANNVYAKKYLSMHYLSLNIGQRWNVGLFEGIMWGDELNQYGFDANFLNPVILYRPVEFSVGASGGNTLMGLTSSYLFGKGIKAYGQVAIDEFTFSEIRDWSNGPWRNMLSWQLGVKWGDALGIRNLFLRAEYNLARPFIYSHRNVITNWGHYNQPLAHPLGANFREVLVQGHYRKGRIQAQAAVHTALVGRDENRDANWGGDIYKANQERSADVGLFPGSGVESQLLYWRAEIAYLANPLYNLRLQLGIQNRTEDEPALGLPNSRHLYLGLSTNLYELYQDY